jgi:hypothetical protein
MSIGYIQYHKIDIFVVLIKFEARGVVGEREAETIQNVL